MTRAFLFADLRGYTDFVERHGDAAAARLLRDYRALVRREVARATGAEVKTEGDSFYVVFDSASAALDCAVAIQLRARTRNAKDATEPIAVGIGLHAGETVAFDQQFVGSAVNVASRLASQAGAGEIVASDTLRGLVRTGTEHSFVDRGELTLKGVSERVRAWTVSWSAGPASRPAAGATREHLLAGAAGPAGPAAGQIVCPIIVGRDAERDQANELLEAAATGRGQTLVLSGEAGVGKSAFVRALIARATSRGFRLLYGATLENDGGLPYAPFLAAVRSGFRGLDRDHLGRVLSQAAPDLAELFPELGRAARTEQAGADQHRLALAFHGLFATFAGEAPVLLVIEDLHWADEASLALLQYLARELRDTRVMLLATYRSDEMHRRHPFLRVLAALQRERLASEITLRRLDKDQVKELIRATFAVSAPDVNVSDEFRDAIHARSGGNPFFTEELLRSLVESGDIYRTDTGWDRKDIAQMRIPGSIKEAVRQRAEGLSQDARSTLATASVIGLQFTFEVLRDARGIDELALEDHLRQLIDAQLVVEVEGGAERYAFRHALTREVVYDDLLVRERKRQHRAVADALVRDATTEPALLAHHLLAAGEKDRAVPALLDAASRAARAGAPREAAAHYASAIEIGLPDEHLPGAVEAQAKAYYFFDIPHSAKVAEEALAIYRERGDRRGQSRMLRLAGRANWLQAKEAEGERLTREAVEILDGEETSELASALAQLAAQFMSRSEIGAATPLADQAIVLAVRVGDTSAQANALITKGSALMPREEGLPFIRQGLELALRTGNVEAATRAYVNGAIALFVAGSPEDRWAFLTEGLTYGRRHGLEGHTLAHLLNLKAFVQMERGDWDPALETAADIEETSVVSASVTMTRGTIAHWRGGPAAALAELEAGARQPHASAFGQLLERGAFAAAYASAGDLDRVREALAQVRAVGEPFPRSSGDRSPRSVMGGPGAAPLTIAAVSVGDVALLDEVEAEIRPSGLADFTRSHVAAGRAILSGDPGSAAGIVARQLDAADRLGLSATARAFATQLASFALARDARLGPEWRVALERARAFATRAGAPYWLTELDRLAAATG